MEEVLGKVAHALSGALYTLCIEPFLCLIRRSTGIEGISLSKDMLTMLFYLLVTIVLTVYFIVLIYIVNPVTLVLIILSHVVCGAVHGRPEQINP